jgi:hypothetical protein
MGVICGHPYQSFEADVSLFISPQELGSHGDRKRAPCCWMRPQARSFDASPRMLMARNTVLKPITFHFCRKLLRPQTRIKKS